MGLNDCHIQKIFLPLARTPSLEVVTAACGLQISLLNLDADPYPLNMNIYLKFNRYVCCHIFLDLFRLPGCGITRKD
ncbi:hypothetical protein OUZ56_002503 [Daphnia magna]|uniref:Uncharacterized protein n=1 Tax=Daphnia magna TaxID=35525 RepID=A0ABR0A5W7_9CRUS|nr:hypothetical protein OUZ56_002503 [Daphnia magna]